MSGLESSNFWEFDEEGKMELNSDKVEEAQDFIRNLFAHNSPKEASLESADHVIARFRKDLNAHLNFLKGEFTCLKGDIQNELGLLRHNLGTLLQAHPIPDIGHRFNEVDVAFNKIKKSDKEREQVVRKFEKYFMKALIDTEDDSVVDTELYNSLMDHAGASGLVLNVMKEIDAYGPLLEGGEQVHERALCIETLQFSSWVESYYELLTTIVSKIPKMSKADHELSPVPDSTASFIRSYFDQYHWKKMLMRFSLYFSNIKPIQEDIEELPIQLMTEVCRIAEEHDLTEVKEIQLALNDILKHSMGFFMAYDDLSAYLFKKEEHLRSDSRFYLQRRLHFSEDYLHYLEENNESLSLQEIQHILGFAFSKFLSNSFEVYVVARLLPLLNQVRLEANSLEDIGTDFEMDFEDDFHDEFDDEHFLDQW